MTPLQIIFLVTALVALAAALLVVTAKNLIHAALWLVVTLFAVAVTFVLLNAGFLAVAQVVIYVGAIAILMIFAVMLTRRLMQDTGSQIHSDWGLSAVIALAVFGGLAWLVTSTSSAAGAPALTPGVDYVAELGKALVSPNAYVIPFEVASVLLLAALIGAIYVAWDKK